MFRDKRAAEEAAQVLYAYESNCNCASDREPRPPSQLPPIEFYMLALSTHIIISKSYDELLSRDNCDRKLHALNLARKTEQEQASIIACGVVQPLLHIVENGDMAPWSLQDMMAAVDRVLPLEMRQERYQYALMSTSSLETVKMTCHDDDDDDDNKDHPSEPTLCIYGCYETEAEAIAVAQTQR
jgi:hypothetical protein